MKKPVPALKPWRRHLSVAWAGPNPRPSGSPRWGTWRAKCGRLEPPWAMTRSTGRACRSGKTRREWQQYGGCTRNERGSCCVRNTGLIRDVSEHGFQVVFGDAGRQLTAQSPFAGGVRGDVEDAAEQCQREV